jgi:hypothetical protein
VPRVQRHLLPSWILYLPIEIMMDLPLQVLGTASGASLGRGRIVRRQTERSDARPAFAAAISEWEVLNVDPRRI